jgi:hypothetical protein
MSSPSFEVLTAAEIARQVNGKRISPTEVLEGAIARIEARNPVVNAFVYTAFDEARAAAKTLEARLARGENLTRPCARRSSTPSIALSTRSTSSSPQRSPPCRSRSARAARPSGPSRSMARRSIRSSAGA